MGPGDIEMFTADYWMMTMLGLAGVAGIMAVASLVVGHVRAMLVAILACAVSVGAFIAVGGEALSQDSTIEVYAQVAAAVRRDPSLAPSLRGYLSDGSLSPIEARAIGDRVDANGHAVMRAEDRRARESARQEKTRMIALYGPKGN